MADCQIANCAIHWAIADRRIGHSDWWIERSAALGDFAHQSTIEYSMHQSAFAQ
jgi:hypothetical protein